MRIEPDLMDDCGRALADTAIQNGKQGENKSLASANEAAMAGAAQGQTSQ